MFSTGKRRYGHPALTGVLPQPWLPLKKDQTLANHGDGLQQQKSDQGSALILTLRKRYSVVGRGGGKLARRSTPVFGDLLSTSPPGKDAPISDPVSNPWTDNSAGPSQTQPSAPSSHHLHHRLSFDQATGVIMLPDNGDWLEINDSDSDLDYGTPSTDSPPEPSDQPENGQEPHVPTAGTPSKRHGTYFHHPEKRRQTVPGAFP